MIGRGTRLANGKDNCLVLDFAGNVERHGPIDRIDGRKRKKDDEEGVAPVKACPDCQTIVHASTRLCPTCGYAFPPPKPDLSRTASTSAILSSQIRRRVGGRYRGLLSPSRKTRQPAQPARRVPLWPRQPSRMGVLRAHWLRPAEGGAVVAEASARSAGAAHRRRGACPVRPLPQPARISVRPQGRYTEIIGYEFPTCSATSAAARPAASAGSMSAGPSTIPAEIGACAISAPSPVRTSAIGGSA